MEVNVIFYATLRDIAGTSHEKVDLGGNTVGDIMDVLVIKYGNRFREEIILPDGTIKQNVKVLINGLNIDRIAPLQTLVKEGDTLYLFPPIMAG